MPHVSERQPKDDDKDQGKPSGELGGHPINADETAPGEAAPAAERGRWHDAPPGRGGRRAGIRPLARQAASVSG